MLEISDQSWAALDRELDRLFAKRNVDLVRTLWSARHDEERPLLDQLTELAGRARRYGLIEDRWALYLFNLEQRHGASFERHAAGPQILEILARCIPVQAKFDRIDRLLVRRGKPT